MFLAFTVNFWTDLTKWLLNWSTASATEAAPEPETKIAETSSPNLFQRLKGKLLHGEKAKGKEAPVKEEPESIAVEPTSVSEAKPELKESKPSFLSKVRKLSIWKNTETKSTEPAAAPVEKEAPKAPESVESSTPPTEVCRKWSISQEQLAFNFPWLQIVHLQPVLYISKGILGLHTSLLESCFCLEGSTTSCSNMLSVAFLPKVETSLA